MKPKLRCHTIVYRQTDKEGAETGRAWYNTEGQLAFKGRIPLLVRLDLLRKHERQPEDPEMGSIAMDQIHVRRKIENQAPDLDKTIREAAEALLLSAKMHRREERWDEWERVSLILSRVVVRARKAPPNRHVARHDVDDT